MDESKISQRPILSEKEEAMGQSMNTRAGNSHVRPVLAEAAWSYRFLLPSAAFAASSIERDLVLFDLETRRR